MFMACNFARNTSINSLLNLNLFSDYLIFPFSYKPFIYKCQVSQFTYISIKAPLYRRFTYKKRKC